MATTTPTWAIVKEEGRTVTLVREPKGTRDFLEIGAAEADKIRCGLQQFEAIGADYTVVMEVPEVWGGTRP